MNKVSNLTLNNEVSYFLGFIYNNGEYSFVNASGGIVEGVTNKVKLQFAIPVEGGKNTKASGGLMCCVVDVDKDRTEDVIQGGYSSLSSHVGAVCECHYDRHGRITFLRWVNE